MCRIRKLVALDIDGVILKGSKVLPGAKEAIFKLSQSKTPFIFITNGGGVDEETKALDLSKKLQMDIQSNQVLLSHTPMKGLVPQFHNSQVLVIGHDRCLDIAKKYGFMKPISIQNIWEEYPHIYPTLPNTNQRVKNTIEKIEAILIFHDPIHWGLEMQIMHDIIATGGLPLNNVNSSSFIPLYVSNADVVYSNEFPLPRFTQGAFIHAFKSLFELQHSNGHRKELKVNFFGKPQPIQYRWAEHLLLDHTLPKVALHPETIRKEFLSGMHAIYAVGDNPISDIRGVTMAGSHWKSILVRTGIFQRPELKNDPVNPADFVCDNISQAIDLILNQ